MQTPPLSPDPFQQEITMYQNSETSICDLTLSCPGPTLRVDGVLANGIADHDLDQ